VPVGGYTLMTAVVHQTSVFLGDTPERLEDVRGWRESVRSHRDQENATYSLSLWGFQMNDCSLAGSQTQCLHYEQWLRCRGHTNSMLGSVRDIPRQLATKRECLTVCGYALLKCIDGVLENAILGDDAVLVSTAVQLLKTLHVHRGCVTRDV
jgi:hypothetical protein